MSAATTVGFGLTVLGLVVVLAAAWWQRRRIGRAVGGEDPGDGEDAGGDAPAGTDGAEGPG